MLKRALIKNKNRISGWLAGIGAVLGILLICVSLQFYTDVKALLDINKEFYTSDFIPVHKKLGGSMLFSYGASAFTQEEMDEMRRQPYSKAVGPIEQGLFKVSGSVSLGPGMPGMATELFFESLDDRFIDIDKKKWKWSAGDLEVPVILPAPYLEMYNFGMAPSQKLPALTEKTLGKFVFNLEISGNNNAARMRGRIVGFSKRINAILVPKSFLAWANGVFGHNKTASVVHLIWEVEDMADPRIGTFLSERGYETSMDILGASRAKSILNVVITVCLLLGSIMVFLAALVFVQYNQLLISRKEYNVKVLFMMGYTRKKLLAIYLRRYVLVMAVITVLVAAGIFAAQYTEVWYLRQYAFIGSVHIHTITWVVLGMSVTVMLLLNAASVFKSLTRIARNPGT